MQKLGLVFGLGLPIAIFIFGKFGEDPVVVRMAAAAVMIAIFWMTEAIPLAATAMLPLALFPILGIADGKKVALQYMNSTVFLLIGGFLIALAMQRWHLHKRLALGVLSLFGSKPIAVLMGFMTATAGLSMWISNTATTLMMLPIALAVIHRFETVLNERQVHQFTVGLLLAIAYSASIGGMMTLVGTAPNLVFAQFYQNLTGNEVGFAQWMLISVPVALVLLLLMSAVFFILFIRKLQPVASLEQVITQEQEKLGRFSTEEKWVLLVFLTTACLWITRKGLHIADFSMPGWGEYLQFGNMINDGNVAVFMALILFFIPAKNSDGTKTKILNDDVFNHLPWSIVLLFGGGFALAYGFTESGLSYYLANQLAGLHAVVLPVLILITTAGMSLLTELTSNTATTQMVLPVLESVSEVVAIKPVYLMLPATLASSCAFMFPVATPPNAIIFGSGKITIREMVSIGLLLNTGAIIIISFLNYYLLPLIEL